MQSDKRRGPSTAERRRIAVSYRLSPAVRDLLLTSSAESGRSLTAESEHRIERSFAASTAFDEALGNTYGVQGAGLLLLLGRVIRSAPAAVGLSLDSDWLGDSAAREALVQEVEVILNILRSGERSLLSIETPAAERALRLMLSLGDITAPKTAFSVWTARVREYLGPTVTDRIIAWRHAWLAKTFPETEGGP
jgi:hypothetical protein